MIAVGPRKHETLHASLADDRRGAEPITKNGDGQWNRFYIHRRTGVPGISMLLLAERLLPVNFGKVDQHARHYPDSSDCSGPEKPYF